jgi:hypothetical protein
VRLFLRTKRNPRNTARRRQHDTKHSPPKNPQNITTTTPQQQEGAYPSPLNYYNFPKSVCTSVNEVVCHGIPDARELVDGDIVNVDVTAYYKGYHGDLNGARYWRRYGGGTG